MIGRALGRCVLGVESSAIRSQSLRKACHGKTL